MSYLISAAGRRRQKSIVCRSIRTSGLLRFQQPADQLAYATLGRSCISASKDFPTAWKSLTEQPQTDQAYDDQDLEKLQNNLRLHPHKHVLL